MSPLEEGNTNTYCYDCYAEFTVEPADDLDEPVLFCPFCGAGLLEEMEEEDFDEDDDDLDDEGLSDSYN